MASDGDPAASGAHVLYLSYDGMTDPLGGSQVLPYVFGLAALGHRITLISFEKPGRSAAEQDAVQASCSKAGIDWQPLAYHKRPPILSAMYDVWQMRRLAERLHREAAFDIVHCRSYLPALVGLALKRRHGTGFLFDMRGFWADERVDGRIWNLANPLIRAVFDFFKRREADFLREADHVVSLTEAGKALLVARPDCRADAPPISVIPCCVDFDAFPPADQVRRAAAREAQGISTDALVAVQLGSIGTWYMLGEMLDFFAVQLARDPRSVFLFITRDDPAPILAAAAAKGIARGSLVIRPASRAEVPDLVAAADYGLFFILPTFSKQASCPTKLGELFALELPVVTNGGVGDVAEMVEESLAGVLVERFDAAAYGDALDRLATLDPGPSGWRDRARRWFDLDRGIERYDEIYRGIAKERNRSTRTGAWEASE